MDEPEGRIVKQFMIILVNILVSKLNQWTWLLIRHFIKNKYSNLKSKENNKISVKEIKEENRIKIKEQLIVKIIIYSKIRPKLNPLM